MFSLFERLELKTSLPEDHDDIIAEGPDEIEGTVDHLEALESNPEKIPYLASSFTVQIQGGDRFTFTSHDGGFKLSDVDGSEETENAFATGQINLPPQDPDVRAALQSLVIHVNILPQTHQGRKN